MTDPAVYMAAIVADLEAGAVHGFDEVQIVSAFYPDEDDVVRLKGRWIAGLNGDEIAVVDFATHGMAARTYLDCLAATQSLDGEFGPTHERNVHGDECEGNGFERGDCSSEC